MGQNDLGEALANGGKLKDLIEASAGDVIAVRAREAEMAALGLELLDKAIADIVPMSVVAEARERLLALYDDRALMMLACALRVRKTETEARFLALRSGPKGLASDLKALKDAALAYTVVATSATPLGALLRDLDENLKRLESPPGWKVDRKGVWAQRADTEVRVANAPIVVSGISFEAETGAERWTLAWQLRGSWQTSDIDRRVASESRLICELASKGAPIGSYNAGEIVQFLADFYGHNVDRLPVVQVTGHLGWQADGSWLPGRSEIRLSVKDSDAKALRGWGDQGGSWPGYRRWVDRYVANYPSPMLAIYASCVPVLLSLLDADGFTVDWSGESSGGKTTTLNVAGATWGNPRWVVHEMESSSDAAPSAYAALLYSLPVILNESQSMRDDRQRKAVGRLLYAIAGGMERARGDVDGSIREQRRWRTCMLTSGESPITSFAEDAVGAHARAVALRGAPFGDAGKVHVDGLREELLEHYGHLGPRFVECARGNGGLRRRYRDLLRKYAGLVVPSKVAARMSGNAAIIHLAAEICHSVGVPGDPDRPMDLLLKAVNQGAQEADRPAEALRMLYGWTLANPHRLWTPRGQPPPQGWAGFVVEDKEIALRQEEVRDILLRARFDPAATLMAWEMRGWLMTNPKEGGYTVRRRFSGGQARMVVVPFNGTVRAVLDIGGAAILGDPTPLGPQEPPDEDPPISDYDDGDPDR